MSKSSASDSATPESTPVSSCQALVIDNNPTSRSILVSQLRDYGVGRIVQCHRAQDARQKLEFQSFDFVLCEQHFGDSQQSGQSLLDDLRRAQLLPFSTVFFMVTGTASYSAVADAAESALDGYLLKPFTPVAFFERLDAARRRKAHLRPIFAAIESQALDEAAALCLERFHARAPYWLYAARIGAELLLHRDRHEQAQALFEAVIAARALPWAKLGVARAQIEAGRIQRALSTLEQLMGEDSTFADAYDVMGGAQMEAGKFDDALATFRTAVGITPGSITRQQKFGMLAYYLGQHKDAIGALQRAVSMGVTSKLFDVQTLVLLSLATFRSDDRKTLDHCAHDFARVLERRPDDLRARRGLAIVEALQQMRQRRFALAIASVREISSAAGAPDFDIESACNLAGLLSLLAATSIQSDDSSATIERLGRRFAVSRNLGELLANACGAHAPYAETLRQSHAEITRMAEGAMALSVAGDPGAAVERLVDDCAGTLNSKLLDVAQQVLLRHRARIASADALQQRIDALRAACGGAGARRLALGQDPQQRQPGALSLRIGSAAPAAAASPAALPVPA
jgi:predicted Zn-dependent protease